MKVMYEDNNIIVIYKPAGVATQSANIASKDCVSLIKEYLKQSQPGNSKGEPYVGIVHRLDQPVSGILVFAKNSKAAAELSRQVGGVGMNKVYRAVVEGVMPQDGEVELKNNIYKDGKEKKAVIVNEGSKNAKLPAGAKLQEAILRYRVEAVREEDNMTNLTVVLQTGRFHQIRAQLANLGHPIAGDRKYGSKVQCPNDFAEEGATAKGAIALEACELTFVHPTTGKQMKFSVAD